MAAVIRRKRKLEEREDLEGEDVQAIFRRAFEARFTPLAPEPGRSQVEAEDIEEDEDDEDDDQDASDWSGISSSSDSDEEEDSGPQIIEYISPLHTKSDTDKALRKAFMSSKPPSSTSTPTTNPNSKQKSKQDDNDDLTEVTNLKNDLALQKLLRDSHLLSASSSGTSSPQTLSATGLARHKSTDLHLQSLGAKTSVFTQKKMPMAQRRHEAQKARMMEEKRRAHAKDAGIVLEKEKRVAKAWMERKREKSLGAPSVGRFKRGVLSLTKKDVRSITRDGEGGGRRGKGKGRGRGGKR